MQFEYDPLKSQANQAKHGINFEQAKLLWNDPHRVEIQAQPHGETRWMVIGKISGKHWSAVITYRGKRIRIISVRCSRKNEVIFYES